MLDFVQIRCSTRVSGKKGSDAVTTIYPEFIVGHSDDLMIRGGAFYAVWDAESGFWSKDPGRVAAIVDSAMREKASEFYDGANLDIRWMRDFSTKKWSEFLSYCNSLPDSYEELDCRVIFANDKVEKGDYATKKLSYPLKAGKMDAYEELISTLYDSNERQKLEWAIGSIISGDSKRIQKFLVLYGAAGSGKSTMLNIVQMLFDGYYNVFEARALTTFSNNFALEMFRDNPLVSIQHDGDLSRIEDNTKLNSIVSHEEMVVNEKRKTQYTTYFRTFLFMGTNKPVKITDAKAGIVRRLIDVSPSGRTVPFDRYLVLMAQVKFELGAIASHCLDIYKGLGMDAYNSYRPLSMLGATNDFYNFVEDHYDEFASAECISLAEAWAMYRTWCDDTAVKYPMSQRAFKEELKSYFGHFAVRQRSGDKFRRNVYSIFLKDKFSYGAMVSAREAIPSKPRLMTLDGRVSTFDKECFDCPAQYANESGTPSKRWDNVKTKLMDIDTSKLHYVKVPENHIVIDFDLKDGNGEKSLELNLEAASKWPDTYAELSKSGSGLHLHYIYDGDPSELSSSYSDGIEVKVFTGNGSLRRKLTRFNDKPIAVLSSGLPKKKKGGKKVISFEGLANEKALRTLIERNLRKEIHPGTKPSVDFIAKILEDAYSSGMHYDVSDMRPAIMAFANNSTNHSVYCLKVVSGMKFHSEEADSGEKWPETGLIFYDVEVFPNLFVVVYKLEGEDAQPVKLVNPEPADIEDFLRNKLVGFNCRRYDNHILYARLMGYNNYQLFEFSKRIIDGSPNAMFREAYNLSYADVYDFCSKKQSLKKWEIELGIHHQELGLHWDEPVPENLWEKVADYCVNDVIATEATFNARIDDFHAREMLAALSGLKINDTTRMHCTKIIFGNDKHPQTKFVYTDLSEMFPGYSFSNGKSLYRGEEVGEGGYVYAEPGYYENVALLDIASMHPHSILALNLFGDEYTAKFRDLLDARMAIKHHDYDTASKMLGGKLAPYLGNPEDADKLAYALKIIINSIYGFTAARFDCEFKDPRNIDNIVAKRGALFMVELKHAVQDRGYSVVHIKTDSIKIPNADAEIIEFVQEFGKKYGYSFEHEATYSKICLVNDAVYIAKKENGDWTATGTQFAVPYIFKTMFSHEDLEFKDFCETKTVTGSSSLYLDMNESLPEGEHDYHFVGKAGSFCPIRPGCGGGVLYREKDGKYYAAAGTKGYRWLEAETVKNLDLHDKIDISYYEDLAVKATATINEFVPYSDLVKE